MATLTAAAVLALVSQYPDWDAEKAAWIVFKESSNRPEAVNQSGPFYGLFQISAIHGYSPDQLLDPATNVAVAHKLWLDRGWQPWPVASQYPERATLEITADGWLTWAERMPGRPITVGQGFNAGINPAMGLVFHSAEGFAQTMLSKTSQWGYYNAQFPWHLSNLLDGRLIQHYPFTARCWHGSAFNDSYVGMEHEGKTPDGSAVGPVLNDLQIANARRVSRSFPWQPKRPVSATDKTATLYEHAEVIRFGGTGTQCPSHRIPWDKILATEIPMELPFGNHKFVADGNRAVLFINGTAAFVFGTSDGLNPGAFGRYAGTPGQPYDPNAWQYLRGSEGHGATEDALWSTTAGV